MLENSKLAGNLGSLIPRAFIGCGEVPLDIGGGVKTIDAKDVKVGDLVLATIKTDDSGTSIVHLRAEALAGQIKFTRIDDGTSADDGVIQYLVVRPE